jgi:hypothetical protein
LRKRGQRLAQALEHAVVVDDQAVFLAAAHAVDAGDGLHQRMALHGLVQVERGQAFHVEAGQPHRADDGDAKGVIGLLELLLQVAFDHLLAVRLDVQRLIAEVAPLGEFGHLALFLRHHHAAFGGLHPLDMFATLCSSFGSALPRDANNASSFATAVSSCVVFSCHLAAISHASSRS